MYYNMYYAFNTCITNVINTKKIAWVRFTQKQLFNYHHL